MDGRRRQMLQHVASAIPTSGARVLVGIDGVDGSGKTRFADDLALVMRATGRAGS